MLSKKQCPLCGLRLSLKQINFNSAVYICEDLKCQYPMGFQCIEVSRSLKDIKKEPKMEEDTDDWITEVIEINRLKTENTKPKEQSTSSNEIHDISDIIDNTIKEIFIKKGSNNLEKPEENVSVEITDQDFDDILSFMNN